MPGLTDPAMRMYLIVRSMIAESKKNLPGQGLRRMTIDQMCFLLTRDTGKPVSVSLMYQILALLEELDLMVPLDTKQDVGASQFKGKEKAVRGILRGFVVRDLPPVPYTGWRNAWDKLNAYRSDWRENPPLPPMHVTVAVVDANGRHLSKVTQVPQNIAFQDSGTESEGSDQGSDQEEDPFQDSGKQFQDSGTGFQEAGTDSGSTSGNAAPKQGSPTTVPKKNDAPSARSAGDARRASDGSSVREAAGGSAASDNDTPSPDQQDDKMQPRTGVKNRGSKLRRKHTVAERTAALAVRQFFPQELAVPDIPAVTDAILEALAAGKPESRTVEQLGARIDRRWYVHGWARRLEAGEEIEQPVGVAIDLVRTYGRDDKWGCSNPRCEDGADVDTGEECRICPERLADRQKGRRAASGSAEPSTAPSRAAKGTVGFRECACRNPIPKGSNDHLCWDCRKKADYDQAASLAAVPQQPGPVDEASYGPPPF
ncbi:hypothetical protein [Streptomyces olivaceoviridis]|uniref:hypothetical protein n=1 Tax=Streptomyces olivaceoviridis TaxID=1921 RepID=UPI0037000C7C